MGQSLNRIKCKSCNLCKLSLTKCRQFASEESKLTFRLTHPNEVKSQCNSEGNRRSAVTALVKQVQLLSQAAPLQANKQTKIPKISLNFPGIFQAFSEEFFRNVSRYRLRARQKNVTGMQRRLISINENCQSFA